MGGKCKDLVKMKRTQLKNKLRQRYDLAIEDYDAMFASQKNLCAICQRPERVEYKRRLSVDHNHKTGKVRGLLCHHCNTAIGKFDDDPNLLDAASLYLKSHEDNS